MHWNIVVPTTNIMCYTTDLISHMAVSVSVTVWPYILLCVCVCSSSMCVSVIIYTTVSSADYMVAHV